MKFTESIKSNIGNIKQPLYDGIQPNNIYYLAFDEDPDVDNVVIPYGQEIKYQNREEFDEAYVDALGKFIGTHVMVSVKYSTYYNFKIRILKKTATNLINVFEHKNIYLHTFMINFSSPIPVHNPIYRIMT